MKLDIIIPQDLRVGKQLFYSPAEKPVASQQLMTSLPKLVAIHLTYEYLVYDQLQGSAPSYWMTMVQSTILKCNQHLLK